MSFPIDLSPIRYLSFDCYGTLVDWESGILQAFSEPFNHFEAIPATDVLQSFAKWESELEAGDFQDYRTVLNQVQSAICNEYRVSTTAENSLAESVGSWQPFPDTTTALRRLKERFGLAILSNVDDDLFASTQAQIGVEFDHVCTAQQIRSYKPCIDNFHYLLERLDCDNSEILHVAQSIYHDHVPAKQLNIQSIWVDRPSRLPGSGATLPTELIPEFRVTSMSELADKLLSE